MNEGEIVRKEHAIDPIETSQDLFLDTALAVVHSVLMQRDLDSCEFNTITIDGLDTKYTTCQNQEIQNNIKSRITALQKEIIKSKLTNTWIIIEFSYVSLVRHWIQSKIKKVWEVWCIPFVITKANAQQIRESINKSMQSIANAAASAIPPKPSSDSKFQFSLSLPIDPDWDKSNEYGFTVNSVLKPSSAFV